MSEPIVLPWPEWYARESRTITQGMHVLFCGPTQSGKTLLCRLVTRFHRYVVVLGTKATDPSLKQYVDDGYVRIDHWPPNPSDIRKSARQNDGDVRLILWPKIKQIKDLKRFRPLYEKCLNSIFIDGGWCVVIDEGLWVTDRKDGLDLGGQLSAIAYGAASNNVSMHLLVQRPANIPPVTWTSCSQALVFHMGRLDDVANLASMGTYTPADAKRAVQQLQGHQFLDLPCRGGAKWSISEVDLSQV